MPKSPISRKPYTDTEARVFEALTHTLAAAPTVAEAVKALVENPETKGFRRDWSMSSALEIIGGDAYAAWQRDYIDRIRLIAEVEAAKRLRDIVSSPTSKDRDALEAAFGLMNGRHMTRRGREIKSVDEETQTQDMPAPPPPEPDGSVTVLGGEDE